MLKSEIVILAREIYNFLAPNALFHGQLKKDKKKPLFIYVINRIPGISYLDFIFINNFPESSDENFVWRKTLISNVARYNFFFVFFYAPNRTTKIFLYFLKESAN